MKDFDDIIAEELAFNNMLVVDGLNLAFRYKHSKKEVFAADFMSTIRSLATSYKAKYIVVLGDAGSTYRKSIYKEYKANRDELRKAQTEEESKEFAKFIEEFNRAFEMCSKEFLTLRYKGCEADDIAAALTDMELPVGHIWLISSDKDWDLLVDDKVSRFSTVTRKEVTANNWSEHYIYDPDDHISVKVLTGDKGDNVPGASLVGEKRAYTLIREYGSALDIYDMLPIKDPKNRVFMKNLNEFKEQIPINYELMDLRSFYEEALLGNLEDIESKTLKYMERIDED